MAIPPPQLQLQHGPGQNQHEQHEGRRRGIAHVPPAEALLVHQQHHAEGAVGRATLGHHIRLGEHLKIANHGHERHEQEGRPQQRQGEVTELSPGAGPIDARRFIELGRDILQAGDEDDHVEAEVLPHRHENDRWHRPVRVAQPVNRLDPEQAQTVVQQPIARVVEVAPHHRHRHQRRDHRQEERGAKEAGEAGQAGVHQQRRAERNRHRQRPTHDHEIKSVAERGPEQRALQQLQIVVETDEAQPVQIAQRVDIEIGEAQQQRRQHRQEEKHRDQQQRRGEKNPGAQGGVAFGTLHRSLLSPAGGRGTGGESCTPRLNSQRRFSRIRSTSRSSAASASSGLTCRRIARSA